MVTEDSQTKTGSNETHLEAEDEDADTILATLEEEDDSSYRAQRTQELRVATATATTSNTVKKAYVTLTGDDETLSVTTEHERAVVHFFHPDFARCSTMDDHCELIAESHAEYADGDVAFARINVTNAPFVVEKLGVRILPCIIGFVKGVVKGRITGFEGLCWDGKESSRDVTRTLEGALVDWTVLRKKLVSSNDDKGSDDDGDVPDRQKAGRRGIRDRKQTIEDEDDDWD